MLWWWKLFNFRWQSFSFSYSRRKTLMTTYESQFTVNFNANELWLPWPQLQLFRWSTQFLRVPAEKKHLLCWTNFETTEKSLTGPNFAFLWDRKSIWRDGRISWPRLCGNRTAGSRTGASLMPYPLHDRACQAVCMQTMTSHVLVFWQRVMPWRQKRRCLVVL